jgi:hypothetical protein
VILFPEDTNQPSKPTTNPTTDLLQTNLHHFSCVAAVFEIPVILTVKRASRRIQKFEYLAALVFTVTV